MLAPIPDQYTVALGDGKWTVEVDSVATDFNAKTHVFAMDGTELTVVQSTSPKQTSVISGTGVSGSQVRVSVVFVSEYGKQRDTSNNLVESIGTSFMVYVL